MRLILVVFYLCSCAGKQSKPVDSSFELVNFAIKNGTTEKFVRHKNKLSPKEILNKLQKDVSAISKDFQLKTGENIYKLNEDELLFIYVIQGTPYSFLKYQSNKLVYSLTLEFNELEGDIYASRVFIKDIESDSYYIINSTP